MGEPNEEEVARVARWMVSHRKAATFACAVCGTEFTARAAGGTRAPTYCSTACRVKAFRQRAKQRQQQPPAETAGEEAARA
jgi:hypothetical protein